MARNKIEDLRNHLFAQLERLSDDELMETPEKRQLEIERAQAMSQVAQVIVNSSRVEVDYMKLLVNAGTPTVKSTFLPAPDND